MSVMMVGSNHQGSATLTLMQAMTGTTAERTITWHGDMAVVCIPDPTPEPPVQVMTVPSPRPAPTEHQAVEHDGVQEQEFCDSMAADVEDSRRRSASEVRRLLHVTAARLMQSQNHQEQPDATASGDDNIHTHSQDRGSRTDATGRSHI